KTYGGIWLQERHGILVSTHRECPDRRPDTGRVSVFRHDVENQRLPIGTPGSRNMACSGLGFRQPFCGAAVDVLLKQAGIAFPVGLKCDRATVFPDRITVSSSERKP